MKTERDTAVELSRYDRSQTYDWNYRHPPLPVDVAVSPITGDFTFCGLAVDSPLGVPAGPLLNGDWCLYYASLGFDVLTYKTVRTQARECYPLPNLLPVDCKALSHSGMAVGAVEPMQQSWAVSFGMPSQPPHVWQADVRRTREQLAKGKLLVVSVVGTVKSGWSLSDLANDYAYAAAMAVQSGADAVEANFSCPNVSTCDGQLYQNHEHAAFVAKHIRQAIGETPLVVKIGHVTTAEATKRLIQSLSPHVNSLAMTNSIAATVQDEANQPYFQGEPRGICGAAILQESVRQVKRFRAEIENQNANVEIVGVGGAASVDSVKLYLEAGANAVHIATAAMVDPGVALAIRENWAK